MDYSDSAALVRSIVEADKLTFQNKLPSTQDVDSKGAFVDYTFSLTQLFASGQSGFTLEIVGGYELHCLSLSSFSSALFQVAFDSDDFLDVAGGQSFIGQFRQAKVRLNPSVVASYGTGGGTNPFPESFAKFRVVRKPSRSFLERGVAKNLGGSKPYYMPQTAGGSTGSSNAPTLPTQGAPLTGVTSVRLFVCAPGGFTLTGGQFRVWLYDVLPGAAYGAANGWYPTDLVVSIAVPAFGAQQKFASSEIPVSFSHQRIYFAGESISGPAVCDAWLFTNGPNGNV